MEVKLPTYSISQGTRRNIRSISQCKEIILTHICTDPIVPLQTCYSSATATLTGAWIGQMKLTDTNIPPSANTPSNLAPLENYLIIGLISVGAVVGIIIAVKIIKSRRMY